MTWQVYIAHADGEEHLAEQLAGPIRDAGYEVAHHGTVLVGESVVAEALKVLEAGNPVVVCGTVRAPGTRWVWQIVNAVRQDSHVRVFVVQMDEEAYLDQLAFGGTIALYSKDPAKAMRDLITALKKYYPLDPASHDILLSNDAERRYRELALESCDIIDLANLPENDRHVATRQLELRRLYVALRVRVELAAGDEGDDTKLKALEKRRVAQWSGIASGRKMDGRRQASSHKREPLGQRLGEARRLVVLGDPGAGKTTLIRWIATAYLLRLKQDPDWKDLPDVATLPDEDWLPIMVRCRDLDQSCLNGALDDILRHTLRKSEMTDIQANALRVVLKDKLDKRQALLLLDGLDEITDPGLRARFCRQLEQIHLAYPNAPIIATSRIVGYREMGYRIGRGFEHVMVADLSREDKDDFARRWCAVTEPPERRETATNELIADIHSSDRIERLTGNPMLLTTMALVKRKVGKLPSRRADLYWDAVEVLLNWRREVDEPLDHREAVPQLEYIAYEMCDRGVQQLREDEIIELLERMRQEYPQVHAVRNHTPQEFLRLLERRTGILVEAGHVRHRGRPVPVFEFRHLTFQEYLAGLALVDGRFPGRDRSLTLAEHVAPLAGRTSELETEFVEKEVAVTENWREALRLCVASCDDDDVDSTLLAILNPQPDEDAQVTARPRAVMAALCLADEPNASEEVARAVLQEFVKQITPNDGGWDTRTSVDGAAMELAASRWAEILRSFLIEDFCRREGSIRWRVGALSGRVAAHSIRVNETELNAWFAEQAVRIVSREEDAIDAALTIVVQAFDGKVRAIPELVGALLSKLKASSPMAFAASWAMLWLNAGYRGGDIWHPSTGELDHIISIISDPTSASEVVESLIRLLLNEQEQWAGEPIIKHSSDSSTVMRRAVEPLLARLDDPDSDVRQVAAQALGQIGDRRAVEPLLARLDDPDSDVRRAVIEVLGQIGDARAVEPLIARLDDPDSDVRQAVAQALGQIGERRGIEALSTRLNNENPDVRQGALGGLVQTCKDETDKRLLSRDLDAVFPFLDPRQEIDEERVADAANDLEMPTKEIRQRYEALAKQFGLKLAWKPAATKTRKKRSRKKVE